MRNHHSLSPRFAVKSKSARLIAASCALLGALSLGGSAFATTYIYTPANTTTDQWAAGTDWSATPTSAVSTTLTFTGTNSTVLATGLTNINTDTVPGTSGTFSLNVLNLQGTGPNSGAASITITGSAGTSLSFAVNGTTNPVVNLNALSGTGSGLTYNVNNNITLTNATTFAGNGTATFNFGGNISGASALTKTGSSILTLTGTDTNSGGVIIDGGAIVINSSVSGGSLVSAGGLTLSSGTLSVIGNSTGTTDSQTGTFTLSAGDNTLSINANGGSGTTLTLGNTWSRATGNGDLALTLSASGTLAANPTTQASIIPYATVNGADFATVSGSTIVAYSGYTVYSTGVAPTSGTGNNLKVDNTSSGNVSLAAGTTSLNSVLVNDTTARILDIGGTNTLNLGSVGAVFTPAGTGALTIGVPGTSGTLTAGSATANSTGELLFINNSANAVTVNSTIANHGTGAVSVSKSGTGTLILNNGSNTYTGATAINGGVLQQGVANALGSVNNTLTDNLGTVDLNGFALGVGALNGAGTIDNTSGTPATLTVGNNNGAGTFTGVIQNTGGALSLTKVGTGLETLSGASTYTGVTSILGGTVSVTVNVPSGSASPLGAATSDILIGDTSGSVSAALRTSNGTNATIARNITIQGGNTGTATLTNVGVSGAGSGTYSGNITLGSTVGGVVTAHGVTITANQFLTTTVSGSIKDPAGLTGPGGVVTIPVSNGATVILSGSNSFTGGIVNSNLLNLSNAYALGTGTLTMNNGASVGGNVTIATANPQIWTGNIATIGASGVLNIGTGNVSMTSNIGWTIDNSGLIVGGVIGDSGSNFSLSYQGGSVGQNSLTLNAANAFGGGMTIKGGNGQPAQLNLGNLAALGTGTFTIGPNGTGVVTIDNTASAGTLTNNNAEVWNGDFTFAGNTLNTGTGGVLLGGNRIVSTTGNLTVGGVIADSGSNFMLSKLGAGTLTLTASNTFGGPMTIGAGTVAVTSIGNQGVAGNLGAGSIINTGSTTNAGTLLYTGAGETTNRTFNLGGTTGGATIDTTGATGALVLSGTWTATGVGAKTLTIQGNTTGNNISGTIVDSSGGATTVTKAGTGTWTLSGSNAYSGITTVSAGTLIVSNSNGLGNSTLATAVTVSNGAILSLQNNGAGNNGTVIFTGTGSANGYNFAVPNASTSTINVDHSTANTGNTIQLGALSFTNGTLDVTNGDGYNLSFSGAATASASSFLTNNMVSGTTTLASLQAGDAGNSRTFTFNGTSPTAVTVVGAITPKATGTLGIMQSGAGMTILDGANTYQSTTVITSGTLELNMAAGGSMLGSDSLTIGTGGGFAVNGAASGAPSTQTLNAVTTVLLNNAAQESTITLLGGVNLSGTTLTNGGLTLVRGNQLGLNSLGTSGAANFTFSTTPTLVGSGASGTPSVGVIANMIGDTSASGSGTGFVTYDSSKGIRLLTAGEQIGTVTAGDNVNISGTTASAAVAVNSLQISGGALTGANTITVNSNVVLVTGSNSGVAGNFAPANGNDFYLITDSDLTMAGNVLLSAVGNVFYKMGPGTLTMNGGGNINGNVTVDAGTLNLNAGTGKVRSIVVNSGTMKFLAGAEQVAGNGFTVATGATADFNGFTGSGVILAGSGTITNTAVGAGTLTVNSGSFAGNITGNLNVSSGGALTLSGSDNYTGTTSITAGTLTANGGFAIGDTSAVTLSNVAGATLALGANETIGSLAGGGTTGGNVTLGSNTLTTGGDGTSPSYAGIVSGAGGLAKIGGGAQTLSGSNTYTGSTSVTGGTLIVSGSLSGTGSVSVGSSATLEADGLVNNSATENISGGTLDGTGSVGPVNLSNGATLAPGVKTTGPVASGTLTASGNVTFSDTASTLSIALGVSSASDNTQLLSGGTVTLDKTPLTLNLGAALSGASDGLLYVIVNGGAGATGSGADVFTVGGNVIANGVPFTTGGYTFELLYGVNAGDTMAGQDIDLQLESVPEPQTWAALLCGLGMLVAGQRLRRRYQR